MPRELLDSGTDAETRRIVDDAIEQLGAFVGSIDVAELPSSDDLLATEFVILFAEAAAIHQPWLRTRAAEYAPLTRDRLEAGSAIPAIHYIDAQRRRRALVEQFAQLHKRFDVLALPAVPVPAMGLDETSPTINGQPTDVFHGLIRVTGPFNVTGHWRSVPCGWTSGGLPVGLQLTGRHFEDHVVLATARAFEQARGEPLRLPASRAQLARRGARMTTYVVRRLLMMLVVMLGVSIVVFGLIHITPAIPPGSCSGRLHATTMYSACAPNSDSISPSTSSTSTWLGGAVQGELGGLDRLAATGDRRRLLQRFGNTTLLAVTAILIAFPGGILIGLASAVGRGSALDRIAMLLATLGLSLPSFWFALMLIILFSLTLRLLPGTGMTSAVGGGGPLDVLAHLILPALALAVVPLAVIARYTRSAVLEVINQEYVVVARAKGLPERLVLVRHVLPTRWS